MIVREHHDMGFADCRRSVDHELAALTKYQPQDVILLYRKNFTFNNHGATALYLYDRSNELTYIYMAFGDESSYVTMQATCRASDLEERDNMLHSFLSAEVRNA